MAQSILILSRAKATQCSKKELKNDDYVYCGIINKVWLNEKSGTTDAPDTIMKSTNGILYFPSESESAWMVLGDNSLTATLRYMNYDQDINVNIYKIDNKSSRVAISTQRGFASHLDNVSDDEMISFLYKQYSVKFLPLGQNNYGQLAVGGGKVNIVIVKGDSLDEKYQKICGSQFTISQMNPAKFGYIDYMRDGKLYVDDTKGRRWSFYMGESGNCNYKQIN